MNIKTKEFNISEAEFRYILRTIYYKNTRIPLIIMAIFVLLSIVICIILPYLGFLAIFNIFLFCFYLANPFIINSATTQPKLNFQTRSCEVSDNYFTTKSIDGSLFKVHFNNFVKATKESEYYFLYIGKTNFYYLPLRAFNSEDDINEFEAALKNKKLMD